MYRLFIVCLLISSLPGIAQQVSYTTSNAHSHNDYQQPIPFWEAWRQGFGSIEADIFLDGDELIVAHTRSQIALHRTLDSLYLQPLQHCIGKNRGYVYQDTSRRLQLMVDIKSDAVATLNKLVEKLKSFPLLIAGTSLRIVISGNRPAPSTFSSWPSWIWFDGEFQKSYNKEELERIEMFSDNFARYSSWKGEGVLPEGDRVVLQKLVAATKQQHKKIRFWNAPDNGNSWLVFLDLKVDFINTDNISGISSFFRELPRPGFKGLMIERIKGSGNLKTRYDLKNP